MKPLVNSQKAIIIAAVAIAAVAVCIAFFMRGPPSQWQGSGYEDRPFGGNPEGPEGGSEGTGPNAPGGTPTEFPPKLKVVAEPAPPEGGYRTVHLGDVDITYFDTVTLPGMWEYSTNIYITLKNNGGSAETIEFTEAKDVLTTFPQWAWQFFEFQESPVTLAPGEEKELKYFLSNEGAGEFSFVIDFESGSETATATITVDSKQDVALYESGAVYGIVKDSSGKPVQGVVVKVISYNNRQTYSGTTNGEGQYAVYVPAVSDIETLFGGRKLPYESLDYFVTVDHDGYSYFYEDGVKPTRSEPYRFDITLSPAAGKLSFGLKWEKQVEEYYGFFWSYADSGWDMIAAQQAKHSPELNKPTNTYMFDSDGNQLWTYPTGNECWGFDVYDDGTVAMGCHDNKIYVVEKDGELRWSYDGGGMVRSVKFSHDGKYLLSGPAVAGYDATLFDAVTGNILKSVGTADQWLRNAKFYADDERFVAGRSAGYVAAYDISGNELWSYIMGEFPMFMDIGTNDVTYGSGKSRTLYAFESDGDVKWEYRFADHAGGAGAISSDGSKIAIGTGNGWVYLFDGSGELLWRVRTDGESIGHNAIAITDDGKYVVAGSAPQNTLYVYDGNGNEVFSYAVTPSPNDILDEKYEGIGYKTSRGTQEGVMHASISADASNIIVAYGDNFVRMFERS